MQTDIAKTIYQRVKGLPIEKQQDILRHVEDMEETPPPTIWQKIRARAERVPTKIWDEMPNDGSEQHDHHLYGTPKK